MATNKDFIVKNGLSVGGDVAITGNVTSDLHLNDNAKIKVGTATDGDLQIYHNVNNSFIEDVGTGSLYLRADASVRIQSYGDWGDMIKADKAGAVTLYHNNGSRLDTTASGVNVTGTVDMDGFTSVGNGTITGDVLIQKGSGFPRITLQDLDGTNTRAFIQYSANTLHLTSQNNTANGRIVFSRYDGTTTTTSGYFDATGKLFTSSDLDVSGNVVSSGNISAVNTTLTGYLRGPASFTIDPAAHADNTGTVIIAGNLQVDGTQTTINSTSLTVDDLNITLASGAADSAAANGAGITVDGASATLLYVSSGDKFAFNKPLDVTGNITLDEDLNFSTNGFADISNTGTGALRFKPSSGTLALTLADANATFAGNVNVTGSSTFAGGTTILPGSGTIIAKLMVRPNSGATGGYKRASLELQDETGTNGWDIKNLADGSDQLTINSKLSNTFTRRLELTPGGDFSLYEDTGANAKFFWDASAESLGIGATPNQILTLDKASGDVFTRFDKSGAIKGLIGIADSTGSGSTASVQGDMIVRGQTNVLLDTAGTTRVKIDSSGNVGIGTASPSTPLHVKKTGSTSAVQEFLRLENHALGGVGAGSSINFHHYHAGSGPAGGALAASINAQNTATWPAGSPSSYSTGLTFSTLHENTFAERMRIESDGAVKLKSAGVVTLKASPLGSTYGAGFNVMTVTGTSSSPYTSTIGFSNYSETNAMVIKGDKVGIGVDPTVPLQVAGEILATNVSFTNGSGSTSVLGATNSMADLNCGTKGFMVRGDGGFIAKNMNNNPFISAYTSQVNLYVSAQAKLQLTATDATFTNHVYPVSDNAIDLGSTSLRWRNLYTTDLHLSNEGKPEGNEVDGTTGNWTIQEGDENLYILNNKTGKKYKFALEEIT